MTQSINRRSGWMILVGAVVAAFAIGACAVDVVEEEDVSEPVRATEALSGSGSGSGGCCSCKSGASCSGNSQLECGKDGDCLWVSSNYPAACKGC